MIKTKQEIRILRKAVKITQAAFNYLVRVIEPGMTERELARKVEKFIRARGAEGLAFKMIIAQEPRSAKPHAFASTQKIVPHKSVMVDMGVRLKGRNSDLTRMVFLGKISPTIRKIYGIVLKAQQRAITNIKPGIKLREIDKAARSYIADKGYGRFFIHATGHGIGRRVHEYPRVSQKTRATLKPGMVITIEPGIYIPKLGGVRIEDMVLVTDTGCEVLTGDINKSVQKRNDHYR